MKIESSPFFIRKPTPAFAHQRDLNNHLTNGSKQKGAWPLGPAPILFRVRDII